ncbi:MarR family winged helix-turn-helix transcriptional regulator [Deinococcus radiotolerans]|uniref:MarR family transcriptional regulator n=1 Tax=Deinococcus radiotolerans TaxID=1309407 RepID=A0ABQ2FLQ6_9DEIO|nr:MarR family transcriptional regulator [Deinococcus radiotolerans]GGL00972.1 MarR family transcriptional regulator [Deinococcus radiotolerans]
MSDRFMQRLNDDWRRTRPDLNVEPMLRVLSLTRLGQRLQAQLDQFLESNGLNAAAWDLLLALYRSAPPEGLTPGELAQACAVHGPAISNRIARLEERALVQRSTQAQDRRSVRITLTLAGRTIVEALLPPYIQLEEHLVIPLTPLSVVALDEATHRLLAALDD